MSLPARLEWLLSGSCRTEEALPTRRSGFTSVSRAAAFAPMQHWRSLASDRGARRDRIRPGRRFYAGPQQVHAVPWERMWTLRRGGRRGLPSGSSRSRWRRTGCPPPLRGMRRTTRWGEVGHQPPADDATEIVCRHRVRRRDGSAVVNPLHGRARGGAVPPSSPRVSSPLRGRPPHPAPGERASLKGTTCSGTRL